MSRYRLLPSPTQEAVLRGHCAHARYVWNLAVEQHAHWRPGRASVPGYLEQCRQLTQARAEHAWLAVGSQMVQQQALRDFAQAMAAFFDPGNQARRPTWRKAGRDEGFRVVGKRGRLRRLQRKLARARRGSGRRKRVKTALARLKTRETDRRRDWAEKTSVRLAREFDVIRVEKLNITSMTRSARGTAAEPGRNVRAKSGLNREIMRSGWGLLARRLQHKASGRVEMVSPAYTSQRCSACGHIAAESRQSQALFACVACSFSGHADVNAARNIAAGHAVTARGGDGAARPVNREPQLLLLPA